MKNIEIIIPYYNDREHIGDALASIYFQTVRNEIHVTVVDDCSEKKCDDIITKFAELGLDISLLRLNENSGPAVARQFAIDVTDSPYIMFVDSDDTLYSPLSVAQLKTAIESNETFVCVWSDFLSQERYYERHHERVTWLFGKIYKRSFLIDEGIRLDDCVNKRGNEDVMFNTKVKIVSYMSNGKYQIGTTDNVTYCWNYNENSITRESKHHFHFDQSYCSFVDNAIGLIEWAENRYGELTQEKIIVDFFVVMYFMFYDMLNAAPMFAKQNEWYIRKFYNKVIRRYENILTTKSLAEAYAVSVADNTKTWIDRGFLPSKGIIDFLNALKDFDENEIHDIWREMAKDPETLELMKLNVKRKLMPDNYWV